MNRPAFTHAVLTAALTLALVGKAQGTTYEVTTGSQLNALLGKRDTTGTAVNGDRIHIIAGGTYIAPAHGWQIRKSLEIYGDGQGPQNMSAGTFTLLQPHDSNDRVLELNTSGETASTIENI